MAKRIFVFGLDGASWKIIDGLIKKGSLPFFKKIISQGVKRNLISTVPPRTAPAWASFATGLNPAEHGIIDFFTEKDPFGKGNREVVSGRMIKGRRFWEKWPKDVGKIALINLPLTYPVSKINGVMVSSLLTPRGCKWFYPNKLGKVLENVSYRIEDFNFLNKVYLNSNSSRERFLEIAKMADAKFKLADKLIKTEAWQFFFLLFSETDWIQHLFWRGPQTAKIYQQMDTYLEKLYHLLVKKYGARNFYFFIISDHGFHSSPKTYFNLYPWLRKEGFLKPSPKASLARIFRKIDFRQKDETASRFNRWGETNLLKVDSFGIRINRRVLNQDFDRFREKLIASLKELKYENKRKVFSLVVKGEGLYPGGRKGKLWDITFLTNPYFAIGPCSIERKIFVPRTTGIKAIHDSDRKGIFLAKGVGIKKLLGDWRDKDIYIWDMPAFFSKILKVDWPVAEKKRKTRTGSARSLTKKEKRRILERLKSLGYV